MTIGCEIFNVSLKEGHDMSTMVYFHLSPSFECDMRMFEDSGQCQGNEIIVSEK
jgi:hypothetical protein